MSSYSISEEDNAMSVDGDVSYCGAEMDEIQSEELKNQAGIKLKDTGGTIHIMIKKSERINKRICATEAGVPYSSNASMAGSKGGVSNSCDEGKKRGVTSSGEWDEEEGEEEESDSQQREDSNLMMGMRRREKSFLDRILTYAICKQDSKNSPAKSEGEMVLDVDAGLKKRASAMPLQTEPRDE